MNFKKIIIMGITMLMVLTACSNKEIEMVSDDSTSDMVYQIGLMSDVGAVPFVVAKEMGYFDEFGVNVELLTFKSALDRDTALQTGNLDAVMADMLSIIFYQDADMPVKMVAKTAGDYRMISSPGLDLAGFNTLDQASVGISSNTVIDFTSDYILQMMGISQKVSGVAIPQMPVRLEMLKSGELQAATLPDPLASTAMYEGGVVIGSTADYDLYPGIMVFSDNVLSNSEDASGIFKAYNKAAHYLNENGKADVYDLLIEALGFSEVLRDNWDLPNYEAISPPDEKTFNIVSDWMFKKGLTDHKYDFNSISNIKYLPQ